jgi:uncharacterized metal-binding protein YceD (DUF177 family)
VKLREFVIPFVGLKEGFHEYYFTLGKEFFEEFPIEDAHSAMVEVSLQLEKKVTMLILQFAASGSVIAECYRCNREVEVLIDAEQKNIVKFGDETYPETEEIIIIPETAFELDVAPLIYELVVLALPQRVVHVSDNECDPEVIEKLRMYSSIEKPIDPRWEGLSKLNKEKE